MASTGSGWEPTVSTTSSSPPNHSLNRTLHSVPLFVPAKTLAQIPPHCSGPVSSNVRPHQEPSGKSCGVFSQILWSTHQHRLLRGHLKVDMPIFCLLMRCKLHRAVFQTTFWAWPNPALNRTHCGRPPFGLKKPSPNASLPQWAG